MFLNSIRASPESNTKLAVTKILQQKLGGNPKKKESSLKIPESVF